MDRSVRLYIPADRAAVRMIYGMDEFARPRLMQKYPGFSRYLADDMSYYPDYEPESLFIAQTAGQVVGALLGAVDTYQFENIYRKKIKPRLLMRTLAWKYGSPGWLPAILKTEWAEREVRAPTVDRSQYPAHLHIGVLPEWRRKGIGTELMNNFIEYLKINRIPGFHLYASSHHPMGIAFYEKLGLEKLGQFHWRLHDGFQWRDVIETIYGIQLS